MVHTGVPFIVPGNQLFMPFLMVDLRERFNRLPPAQGKRLSPSTQCILLYHLIKEPIVGVPLRGIAEKVGYSPMMLSRAKYELEAGGLCQTSRKGRSVVLEFHEHGPSLWEHAQSLLSSPIRKTHWIFSFKLNRNSSLRHVKYRKRCSKPTGTAVVKYGLFHYFAPLMCCLRTSTKLSISSLVRFSVAVSIIAPPPRPGIGSPARYPFSSM